MNARHTPPTPAGPTKPAAAKPVPGVDALPAVDQVDTSYLETLLGYNARRTALAVISEFLPRMAQFNLRPVDFSILSVIRHNAGITSRQLCDALNLLPPNLVGKISELEKRGLLRRQPHPLDGRALGLHLTDEGHGLMQRAEVTAFELENDAAKALTAAERKTLIRLLQKVYRR